MPNLGSLVRPLFVVSPSDLPPPTTGDHHAALRLRQVVETVTECCQLTLIDHRLDQVAARLDGYPDELRGFAYEGAGVGLAALDTLLPWRRRTRVLVDGRGAAYRYAIYLGAGMGLARVHRTPETFRRRLGDDVFAWVVWDGYGFHQGFFAHRRHIQERVLPAKISGYARCVFDQGLGRSIWFASGADADRIVDTIEAFSLERQGDLWAGIGLACGYTGGVDADTIASIRDQAGDHAPRLAEGVIVAAKNRHDVGNIADHSETACRVLAGMSSLDAAELAGTALVGLPLDGVEPAYALWRRRLRVTSATRPPCPAC